MSIQIALGKRYTIDLGEFGGMPILSRFSFDNRNPELIEIRRGVILPMKPGTARVDIYDSSTGKSATKIYNITNPAFPRTLAVPQRGVVSKKTDRTHTTVAFFEPLADSRFGQQPLQVAIENNAWQIKLGSTSTWFKLADSAIDNNGDPQPVWPGGEARVYESNFGTLWLIFDPSPPVFSENNVDILTWRSFSDTI